MTIIDEARANLRFAVSGVRRRPLLSLIVVVTLTLGIGISSGVYAALDVVAFRPRVEGDPRTFVRLFASYATDSTRPTFPGATALSDYLAIRERARSLRALAGSQGMAATIEGESAPTRGMLVTCEFFDVYALAHPLAGRVLTAEDCAARAPVAVVGDSFWRDRFAGATDIVGRMIHLNGRAVQIVGVTPASFSGEMNDEGFWVPYTIRGYLGLGSDDPSAHDALRLNLDGRLKDGYSRSDTRAEVAVIAAQQDRLHPGRRTVTYTTDGSMIEKPGNAAAAAPIIALMLAALACLALVACANVVSLLLARAHARQREMAVRIALGSGTLRLACMLLTETLLAAGVAGVAAGYIAQRTPAVLLPWLTQRPHTFPTRPDWSVFAFLTALTIVVGLAVGSAPVRASLDLDLVGALKGLTGDSPHTRRRAGAILVASQIGAALLLLVGAAALVRMPARVAAAPPRFETSHVMALNLVAPERSGDRGGWRRYHDDVSTSLTSVPGVEAIAFGSAVPAGDERTGAMVVTPTGQSRRELPTIQVSPNYFGAFGIGILRGRDFTAADAGCTSGVCPAVVSRETARELWPQGDPLGTRLVIDRSTTFEIVGVVGDATSRVASPSEALMVYRPWSPAAQRYHTFVRFRGAAEPMTRAILGAVRQRFPDAVIAPQTIQASIDQLTAAFERLGMIVCAVALVAAVLAIVGVYGVVSLAARRRAKEMGIRIALGARSGDVYRAILASSAPPLAVGLGVGLVIAVGVAFAVDRVAGPALPAHVFDPLAFTGAALALTVVAVAAVMGPARRAAGVDPLDVLREE